MLVNQDPPRPCDSDSDCNAQFRCLEGNKCGRLQQLFVCVTEEDVSDFPPRTHLLSRKIY